MQVLDQKIHAKLQTIATGKGITLQELIRVTIIPDWLFYLPDAPKFIKRRKK